MKKLLIALCLVLTATVSRAAKAFPEPVTITQSDGTRLTVMAYGDEDFNWYTTTDGVLLAHEGYDFFVAAIDEAGNLQATPLLAHEKTLRSQQELSAIAMQAPLMAAFSKRSAEVSQKANAVRRIPVGNPTTPYFPHTGSPKAMVILVQFSDLSFSVSDPVRSFNDYLNGEGALPNYGLREDRNHGSVRQYFADMSQGMFTPKFDVFGPVTLSKSYTYYGQNSGNSKDIHCDELVKDACKAIADTVDFALYDSNGDNRVDLVYIIYAGYAESVSGNSSDCIWPKSGTMSGGVYNGISVSRYGVNNELNYTPKRTFKEDPQKRINGIGLFCHEFSHTLGLPDMYPTTSAAMAVDNQTMEYWDLMDSGEYTDNGYTPTPYTPWEREVMGWAELEELTDTAQINLAEDKYYKISSPDGSEYVVLQNFQNTGWGTQTPGHGLLVYRIDYTNASGQPRTTVNLGDYPNNTAGKPGMTLIPADSLIINYYRVYGDDEKYKTDAMPYSSVEYQQSHFGDPYPGTSAVTEIKQMTLNRSTLDKPIYNIREENGQLTFDYMKDFVAAGIESVSQARDNGKQAVFDLSGRRIEGTPKQKGIYIYNNKKVVVK